MFSIPSFLEWEKGTTWTLTKHGSKCQLGQITLNDSERLKKSLKMTTEPLGV